MAMIERVKSKRVRGKLLQDQLTLVEAIRYARGLESTDQYDTKLENQTPKDVTVKQEVEKITVDGTGKNPVLIAGNNVRTKGDQENVRLSASSVCNALKGTTSRIIVKANKKSMKEVTYGGQKKKTVTPHSPLQKRESTGASFLY